MAVFIMLVGLPGCGKSTLAKTWAERTEKCAIVSTDQIRAEIWGDENEQREPAKVFEVARARVRNYLEKGYDVIFDATNINAKRRAGFLKQLNSWKINCTKACAIVGTTIEDCIKRQAYRERKVPEDVIWKMAKSFQIPTKSEGWDMIIPYFTGECYDLDDILEKCKLMPHDNPHHKLSIGEHMKAAEEKLGIGAPMNLRYATKFHDIGKYYTKTFTNSKGEVTSEAHYYGHQNVGAYMCLFGRVKDSYPIYLMYRYEIALLVQYHMEHYIREEKGMDKLKVILGDRLFDMLEQLHLCDKAAH